MKKIGILTFHYSDNYGAVLQAYALRKKINRIPGCKCDIVNFIPPGFTYSLYQNKKEVRESLIKKRELFDDFLIRYCGMDGTEVSDLQETDYDVYVVGSDQVWNLDFADKNYLLSSIGEKRRKVAYAASIGISTEKAGRYSPLFAQYLPEFSAISVREEEHVRFLEDVAKVSSCSVLDPTLLLEAEDYKEIMTDYSKPEKPFLFFFWLRHDDELMKGVEFANQIARKYDLEILHNVVEARPYMFHKDAGCMMYEGIEKFLWCIKNAAFVVTNSYHGTLFSIQMRTPFYTFVVQKMKSRIDMLVKKLGIGDRVVKEYISPAKIHGEIDFEEIEQKIKRERIHSEQFLSEAINPNANGYGKDEKRESES